MFWGMVNFYYVMDYIVEILVINMIVKLVLGMKLEGIFFYYILGNSIGFFFFWLVFIGLRIMFLIRFL